MEPRFQCYEWKGRVDSKNARFCQESSRGIQLFSFCPWSVVHLFLKAIPEELAEQITLLEFNAFRQISPEEVLNKSFSGREKEKKAPNLTKLVANFNWVSYWISSKV